MVRSKQVWGAKLLWVEAYGQAVMLSRSKVGWRRSERGCTEMGFELWWAGLGVFCGEGSEKVRWVEMSWVGATRRGAAPAVGYNGYTC